MRADIHDGQEHERSIYGPDTEAQDQSTPSLTSGLQHTAGPYSWVIFDRGSELYRPAHFRFAPKATVCRQTAMCR
jgi:hypothetical protein